MRTTRNLSCFRYLLASPLVIAALVVSPGLVAAQNIVQRPADPAADFQKFLPQVPPIPWLEARSALAHGGRRVPDSGNVAAWLPTPNAAASWSSGQTQAALAGNDTVGM